MEFQAQLDGRPISVSDQPERNTTGAVSAKPSRQQRACETCRHLKIRCIFDPNNTSGSCVKCTKLNQPCNVRTYYRKKRTKKADSRVADLERKMEALTASLEVQKRLQSSVPPHGSRQQSLNGIHDTPPSPHETDDTPESSGPSPDHAADSDNRVCPPGVRSFWDNETDIPNVHAQADGESSVDVIDRGILDADTAYEIFYKYHRNTSRHLPFVVFPSDVEAKEIRQQKPNLFLAVLAVAVGHVRPDLEVTLIRENYKSLAEKTIVEGKATLDLVQALLLTSMYVPPSAPNEGRNFTYITHLAATMAMDLDLGNKPHMNSFKDSIGDYCLPTSFPKAETAESRRTWLGCYFASSMMGTLLRRPPIHRWDSHVEECIRTLETGPDILPTDAWVCHLVRCQRISEDVQRQFGLDGINPTVSFGELKTTLQLRTFDDQVADWQASATDKMPQDLVQLSYALTSMYIHQSSLQLDTDGDEAKNSTTAKESSQSLIGTTQASSLISCLEACCKSFDAFLLLGEANIRTLPVTFFVRILFSLLFLIHLDRLVNSSQNNTIFRAEDVRCSEYLSKVEEMFAKISLGLPNRSATCYSFIVSKLTQWHRAVVRKQNTMNLAQTPNMSSARTNLSALSEVQTMPTPPISDGTDLSTTLTPELPQQALEDFELMDWGTDGMDSMMEGMGMGWMTSGFNFNSGFWAG